MQNLELSQVEQEKVARVAGSFIGKLFFGGAKVAKATGIVTKKATDFTAGGLRKSADVIETVGDTANTICNETHDKLMRKREDYIF